MEENEYIERIFDEHERAVSYKSSMGDMGLYEQVRLMEHVKVKGLMCMAPLCGDERVVHETFAAARRLFDDLRAQDAYLSVLSMGMSGDACIALEEGSTLVRMGTALFGQRAGYNHIAQ